jgi:hypothetical protein
MNGSKVLIRQKEILIFSNHFFLKLKNFSNGVPSHTIQGQTMKIVNTRMTFGMEKIVTSAITLLNVRIHAIYELE